MTTSREAGLREARFFSRYFRVKPGVEDVLDDQHVSSLDVLIEVFQDSYHSGAMRRTSIARDRHEVDLDRAGHLSGEVRDEQGCPAQDRDEQDRLVPVGAPRSARRARRPGRGSAPRSVRSTSTSIVLAHASPFSRILTRDRHVNLIARVVSGPTRYSSLIRTPASQTMRSAVADHRRRLPCPPRDFRVDEQVGELPGSFHAERPHPVARTNAVHDEGISDLRCVDNDRIRRAGNIVGTDLLGA